MNAVSRIGGVALVGLLVHSGVAQKQRQQTGTHAVPEGPSGNDCDGLGGVESLGFATGSRIGLLELSMAGAPVPAHPFHVEVRGGLAGALGCLVVGTEAIPKDLPNYGAVLFPAGESFFRTFTLDGDGASGPLQQQVPVSPSFCGREIVVQGLAFDPGALGGLAFTKALRIRFGEARAESLFPVGRYDAIGGAQDVAVGDLNVDKHPDLVITGYEGMFVYLGNGSGGFDLFAHYPQFPSGSETAIVDLDGDRIPDVVSADNFVLRLLRGVGDGSLELIANYQGGYSERIAVADVNADSVPDVIVGCYVQEFEHLGHSDLCVYLGNGDGTLAAGPILEARDVPSRIECADFNKDGRIDVAVAFRQTDRVKIYMGRGHAYRGTNSSFAAAQVHAFDRLWTLRIGDMNEDGVPDIVVGRARDIELLEGAGDGTFTRRMIANVNASLTSMVVGDLDADGHQDIVYGLNDDDRLVVLRGRGDGTVESNWSVTWPAITLAPELLDANGDNALDLAVVTGGSASVLLGKGDATFDVPRVLDVTMGGSFAVGYLNGDPWPDIAGLQHGSFRILLGQADGTFVSGETRATGQTPRELVLADFNADGREDVAVANASDHFVSVFLAPLFEEVSYEVGADQLAIATGDLNGDAFPDLILGIGASIHFGQGDGTFLPAGGPDLVGARSIKVVDLDGDADLDLAVLRGTQLLVYLGAGDGSFGTPFHTIGVYGVDLEAGDLNGDGIPDLVFTKSNTYVSVCQGLGDGSFLEPVEFPVTFPRGSATLTAVGIGDVDRDRIPDLVVARESRGDVAILTGRGDGTFEPAAGFYARLNLPRALAVVDVTGDQLPEVLVSGSGGLAVLDNGLLGRISPER